MKDTIELLKETKVSFYGKVTYNKPLRDVSLFNWVTYYSDKYKDDIINIRNINEYDEKRAKALKSELLPCISVTGHFPEYRRIYLADRMNPIICIDIDKGDNPEINDWEEVKRKVMSLKGVFYSSLSCRGEGVFCYVYWNTEKDFLKVWYALERDFKEKLGIIIDNKCKDITRLRFLSYDSNTLIRNQVEMYEDEYEKYERCDSYDLETYLNEDDFFTFKAIHHLIKKCNYRANDYNDWLKDGFRLATLGEYGEVLFMMLSQMSDNYDEDAALSKFKECSRRTRLGKGSLAYYFARLKEYYGADWKSKI